MRCASARKVEPCSRAPIYTTRGLRSCGKAPSLSSITSNGRNPLAMGVNAEATSSAREDATFPRKASVTCSFSSASNFAGNAVLRSSSETAPQRSRASLSSAIPTKKRRVRGSSLRIQIWVGVSFDPDRCEGAVAGYDRRRVVIREEFRANRMNDVFHRRATQIPAPDRAGKERVAGEKRELGAVVDLKRNAAGSVPRRVQHAAANAAGFQEIAVAQGTVQ